MRNKRNKTEEGGSESRYKNKNKSKPSARDEVSKKGKFSYSKENKGPSKAGRDSYKKEDKGNTGLSNKYSEKPEYARPKPSGTKSFKSKNTSPHSSSRENRGKNTYTSSEKRYKQADSRNERRFYKEENDTPREPSTFRKKFSSNEESRPPRKRNIGFDEEGNKRTSGKKAFYDRKDSHSKRRNSSRTGKEVSDKEIQPKNAGEIRLNRYIANAGVCSRRDADLLIQAGEIAVNGKVVTELGFKVKPGDEVRHNNRRLKREKMVYVLLNKPKDFITTTDDPENRKTVMQLVEGAGDERIYPVGRLDRNTTGLIVLTNDGVLADKLSHPSNNVKKIYQVDLDKPITQEDLMKIQGGVNLEDGLAEVDEVAVVSPDKKTLGLEIHSGKNRIVRRIFEHLGYEVVKLDRVMYAGLDKKDLPRGNWRYLTEKEIIRLKHLK